MTQDRNFYPYPQKEEQKGLSRKKLHLLLNREKKGKRKSPIKDWGKTKEKERFPIKDKRKAKENIQKSCWTRQYLNNVQNCYKQERKENQP